MTSFQNIWLIPAVISIIISAGCESGSNPSQPAETTIYSVKTARLQPENVRQIIEGYGNLTYRRKTNISVAVDGIIRELLCEEGDTVMAGEEIARLDNIQLGIRVEQAEAELNSARALLRLAETEYREVRLQVESRLLAISRSELSLKQKALELEHQQKLLCNKSELLKIGGITEEELSGLAIGVSSLETEVMSLQKDIQIQQIGFRDQDIHFYGFEVPDDESEREKILIDINSLSSKSEMETAEARVISAETEFSSARALLEETLLKSPITGIIAARYMEQGERVNAGDRLFTIFDSEQMDLVFAVPEKVGIMLEPGEGIKLSVDAAGRDLDAVIRSINPTVEPGSGNITVKAGLQNPDGFLKPGMFSRFRLRYGSENSRILIPHEAVVKLEGNRGLVFRSSGGRAYPCNITCETDTEGNYILKEGLKAGDEVILNTPIMLKEGDKIDVE
ncbi:MAG: efflux RND transporter periplasmic adaptor subunit [Spirochaetales bacterium]|uniref:Efflux RND transporter periplasmic adaptor subunit n=1 Tax=Candidatus Thalassospirochaeta sargassi TaxID=3119039 RepID=A0AAJ1IF87_9SPIO|nr:efflux RND transporter periplasmic adaptor subunit [Spirochaetales bacterium]